MSEIKEDLIEIIRNMNGDPRLAILVEAEDESPFMRSGMVKIVRDGVVRPIAGDIAFTAKASRGTATLTVDSARFTD